MSIGLIVFMLTALAKVVFPAILSVAAFVVAGVTASNGENIASLVSAVVGIICSLLGFYLARTSLKQTTELLEKMEEGAQSGRDDGEDA